MTLLWLSVSDCSGVRVELALFGRGKSWVRHRVTDMLLTHAQRPTCLNLNVAFKEKHSILFKLKSVVFESVFIVLTNK